MSCLVIAISFNRIFTREKNPSDTVVNKVLAIAREKGFSTSVLFDVVHDNNCGSANRFLAENDHGGNHSYLRGN
jgi:hypothetical protein